MQYDKQSRLGFSMIELLVVITVITLLMTLLIGASYRFVVGARESGTAGTIMKIDGILQDRIRAFHEFDFNDSAIIGSNSWNSNASNANDINPAAPDLPLTMTPALAEVLIRKARFRKAFPQAFSEIDAAQGARFFGSATIPPASPYDSKYECGIVLYAMLLKGETFGAPTPGDDTFTTAEVKVSPETGLLPCLVDAWGQPIRFYRWPTRLLRCGEQDFDGNGSFDDYNQNGTQDSGGIASPIIRPYSNPGASGNPVFSGPTPASLLISSLPPFERNTTYALGADGAPGVLGVDDDQNGVTDWSSPGVPDPGEIGAPDSDDPEFLNTDPDDPTFKLSAWFFTGVASNQTTRRTQFTVNVLSGANVTNIVGPQQNGFHDRYTFHAPLIVSSGPDTKLGLFEPSDLTNFGNLAAPLVGTVTANKNSTLQALFDNITNLNQRAGGK